MNVVLNPDEIQTLQLNDKIFIDGHYYRINYIQGANLIERSSVPVELLKTLPRKLKYPRRRIYTQPNIYVDVVQNDLNENGETGYTSYQTGLPVTSSNIITQASTRDGNTVFESSVIWDTTKTVTYNPKISLVGTANYDESSNNVLVLGDAVEVPQATKNVGLFNPTHYDSSSIYKPNTVYVGANVVTGRTSTEPKVIDLGQFQNYYITGSDNQYPFYYFNWVGTGSGINYVYLPDADELNGVAYQMQVSESYTSGREIVIVPSGSQTIEKKLYPSGSVILTVTESMYEFKSVNGEWLSTIKPQTGSINPPSRGSYISIYSTASNAINIANRMFTASFTTVDFCNDIYSITCAKVSEGNFEIEFREIKQSKTYNQLKGIHKLCEIYGAYMTEALGCKVNSENAKESLKYAINYTRLANEGEALAEALKIKRLKELQGGKMKLSELQDLIAGLKICYRVPASFADATLKEMQELIEKVHELGRDRGWHDLVLTNQEMQAMINYYK